MGWTATIILGPILISRANSAFCRLPPESCLIGVSWLGVTMPKVSISVCTKLRMETESRNGPRDSGGLAIALEDGIIADRQIGDKAHAQTGLRGCGSPRRR